MKTKAYLYKNVQGIQKNKSQKTPDDKWYRKQDIEKNNMRKKVQDG